MDRLTASPRVVVVLLSGVVLATAAWLAACPDFAPADEHASAAATGSPVESPGQSAVPGNQIRIVLPPGFPEQSIIRVKPSTLPVPDGLQVTVLPEDRTSSEPNGAPDRQQMMPRKWMSVTAGPADAFRWRLDEPWAEPVVGVRSEPLQPDGAGGDDDPAPPEGLAVEQQRPQPLDRPAGSLLLPPDRSMKRSIQLERIARQADRQIRHGYELAGRGAHFAARAEFIRALWLVAQGLDAEHQTVVHSRALSAGLAAIREADDFIPDGSRLETNLDIAAIIGGHRTPVLKDVGTDNLVPLSALKCYFTFAQEQFGVAAGREVAGSMALHALGKSYAALAGEKGIRVRAAEPKAMTFYQAALLVYPRNPLASNDLGVLLARCGNYHDARGILEHSLSAHRQSSGWHNLAVVYEQLGQAENARGARQQAEAARRAETALREARKLPANQAVRWVDPETFAKSYARTPDARQPMPLQTKATQSKPNRPVAASAPAPAKTKSATAWRWPWDSIQKRK